MCTGEYHSSHVTLVLVFLYNKIHFSVKDGGLCRNEDFSGLSVFSLEWDLEPAWHTVAPHSSTPPRSVASGKENTEDGSLALCGVFNNHESGRLTRLHFLSLVPISSSFRKWLMSSCCVSGYVLQAESLPHRCVQQWVQGNAWPKRGITESVSFSLDEPGSRTAVPQVYGFPRSLGKAVLAAQGTVHEEPLG